MSFYSHEMQERDGDSKGKVRLAVSVETGDQCNERSRRGKQEHRSTR